MLHFRKNDRGNEREIDPTSARSYPPYLDRHQKILSPSTASDLPAQFARGVEGVHVQIRPILQRRRSAPVVPIVRRRDHPEADVVPRTSRERRIRARPEEVLHNVVVPAHRS